MKYIDTTVSDGFAKEVSKSDSALSLAGAGLCFAKSRYPTIDCEWYLSQLELIAAEVLKRTSLSNSFEQTLAKLVEYIFVELGYRGNLENYYDPKNSFLHEVIERRLGIPISLSVIFLEVAGRVGLDAEGIPFPGHFLVSVKNPIHPSGEAIIVDPFDSGSSLDIQTFVTRFAERLEEAPERAEIEALLRPASKKQILIRQLRNLLAIYSNKKSQEECLLVVNHILYLDNNSLNELLHRGALLSEMGGQSSAIEDYQRALQLTDDVKLVEKLETLIRDAKLQRKSLH